VNLADELVTPGDLLCIARPLFVCSRRFYQAKSYFQALTALCRLLSLAMQLAPSPSTRCTSSSASAAVHQLCRTSSATKRNIRANGLLVKEPFTSSRHSTPVLTEEAADYQEEGQQLEMTAQKPAVDQLLLAKVTQG
jgi:hypothetical protein